jgi:CheY-like chemotaxis protein
MNNRHFLLIDDDCEDTDLFIEAVHSLDATVSCLNAEHGEDAFGKLGNGLEQMPDLIFLDLNMPVMNGWQFLEKLKQDDEWKKIPVIIYSTSSGRANLKHALDAGALCFFTKPDEFQRLKKILKIILKYMSEDDLEHVCEAIQRA